MPTSIMFYVKELMPCMRANATRSIEHGAYLIGGYPKAASAYAMVLLAASASRLAKDLRHLCHLVMHACIALLGMHGIPMNAMRLTYAIATTTEPPRATAAHRRHHRRRATKMNSSLSSSKILTRQRRAPTTRTASKTRTRATRTSRRSGRRGRHAT